MSILSEILAKKRTEVEERKRLYPAPLLERSPYFATPTVSLGAYLRRDDLVGVIAEIKRRSPSKGDINPHVSVMNLSIGYMQAGASALSVLTDGPFFGGSLEDLKTARSWNYCPILRKDFIIDEYQMLEARAAGADAVLLIVAALDPERLASLSAFARSLGLETLVEVHDREELRIALDAEPALVGVNNRSLATFKVDLNTSLELIESIPKGTTAVTESGISSPETLRIFRAAGYRGFLIGEHFMKHARPERSCAEFVRQVRAISGA
jgi:indole-3-glycerol phosphate synthase